MSDTKGKASGGASVKLRGADLSGKVKLDHGSSDDLERTRLDNNQAKKLIQKITASGDVRFTNHAKQRLLERSMSTLDVMNVLRCGKLIRKEADPEGRINYRVEIDAMFAVVGILSKSDLRIITAGRRAKR
jgi:Domain of unknown function (DUF4258)